MKKIIAFVLCFAIVFLFAGCKADELRPEEYISEAALTQCRIRVMANQRFYNDVFVLGHLKVDESKKFDKDGKTYAPVDDLYHTYQELKDDLSQTYTSECVDSILSTYDFYKDIDGKLCFDLSCSDKIKKGTKYVLGDKHEPELEGTDGNVYEIEFYFVCGKKDEMHTFEFVKVDSAYLLKELTQVH